MSSVSCDLPSDLLPNGLQCEGCRLVLSLLVEMPKASGDLVVNTLAFPFFNIVTELILGDSVLSYI